MRRRGALAAFLLLYFALGGAMFFMPFDLIRGQGFSATMAGAAMIMGLFSGLAE